MAIVQFSSVTGEQYIVPDRLCGEDGHEIEIVVCSSGEFIDPSSQELTFMSRPEPPSIERLEVSPNRSVAMEVNMGDVWHPSEDEMNLAREEGDELRKLLRGYYG